MATRTRPPIDPATSPRQVLEGRVVTMNTRFKVLARGRLYMENGALVAVLDAQAPAPAGFEDTKVIDTGATLYPGLIDLHNHMPYNVLPMWQVPRKFGNRGQWASHPDYRTLVTGPMQTLAATDSLLASICRYVEAKSLLGGTTTGQGITLASAAGIRRYFKGVVRNVEATDDEALPEVSTRVPDVAARDAQAFFTRLKKERTCYLLHLSEGRDKTAHRAFEALRLSPDEWAITPALCGIHAAALEAADFEVMAQRGGAMVWSPFSNLLLYGGTADMAAAKAAGLPCALGPDWSPTGSRNLLGELKVAHVWSEVLGGGVFSPRELVAMVTREAAGVLEWQAAVGSLEAGKRADVLAIDGRSGDPYVQLVRAKESDIALVLINGVARLGSTALMRALKMKGESLKIAGRSRTVYLDHPNADPLSSTLGLGDARDALTAGLRKLPSLARQAEKPQAVSAAARLRDAPMVWRLALDEIQATGMDVRANLPAVDARGRTLRAAAMRPVLPLLAQGLATALAPMDLDVLTVVDDASYLDTLRAQRNLPESVRAGVEELWH